MMAIALRLLSICPRVRKRKGRLVATTAWRMRILTLGCLYRKVVVDPGRQELILTRRYCWFFRKRYRFPFAAIEAVTYGYRDMEYHGPLTWGHDSRDLFAVGIRLHGGEEFHLFTFMGEGTFSNRGPLPDWLYWPQAVLDLSGTQEKESRAYVEVLCKLIGAPLAPGRS